MIITKQAYPGRYKSRRSSKPKLLNKKQENVTHIRILHLVLISIISLQSTCYSAPVWKILSKSTTLCRIKLTSCRFSRWLISAILDFRGPIMGSVRSPCTTSYRSSIETIALNCLVFHKIAFLHFGIKIQAGRSPPSWILEVQ